MRVATYTRVAALDRRRPSNLERRQRRLVTYISSRTGWCHTGTYCDVGEGYALDRPGLSRLLADAAAGSFDLVLIDDATQLGPNRRSRRPILDRLAGAGIRVHSLEFSRRAALAALVDLAFIDSLWGSPR
jgi:DNA invertase Pin-like site-specific DNA recombinase